MIRTVRRIAFFVAAVVFMVGPVGAADPYDINVVIPMTGGAAFVGKEISNALHVVEDEANKTGGIRGRPVRFVVADDQTNPQVAVQVTSTIIANKAPVFLGSALAAMCNAQAALAKDGPLMYCFSPSINPTAGSYVFSGMYASDDLNAVSIRYLRERGLRKIALLNGTDASGQEAEHALIAIAHESENSSVSLVAIERFNLSDISIAAQVARIKAAGAQAIVTFVSTAALGTVLHDITDAGLDIPIVTSTSNASYAQLQTYRTNMPKELLFAAPPILAPDQISDIAVRRSVQHVADVFKAAGIRAGNLQALAWDVAQITITALQQVGPNATPEQLRVAIAGLRGWYGGMGRYDFRAVPQRGLVQNSLVMVRWDPTSSSFVAVSQPGGAPLRNR
jgi:branched-chain amino acid transport system substrate-binding protein